MTAILSIRQERVDDIPVIIGVAQRLGLAEILDRHLGPHGSQEGLNKGQLAVGGLAYILSQGDHRKSAVRSWAHDLSHTLERLLGQPIREVDFSDDRLGGVLRRLSDCCIICGCLPHSIRTWPIIRHRPPEFTRKSR